MGVFSEFVTEIEDIFIKGDGRFGLEVLVGPNFQEHLGQLSRTCSKRGLERDLVAKLHYDNGNPSDATAVRVVISGGTVGYLTDRDARLFRNRIEQAGLSGIIVSCNALIGGGKRIGLFKKSDLEVYLDLPLREL